MPWDPTTEQQAVIAHACDSHARLLAGPGTGKSATVIRMMLRTADELGRRGKLLTFTRAATNELREKVAEHAEQLARPSTIHSFAISTLLANEGTSGLPEPIRLADDWEWSELIRHHLKELVDCDVRMIERARAEMASNWESLEPTEDPDLPEDVRNRFAGVWEHHRQIVGYSLLAELPYRLLRALEDHPDLVIGDWNYLVVDEYQDLNQCDLSVLKQITQRDRALVATGDDDQSIYSFRRAHPIGIRRFISDDYPGAVDLTLSISQRCATRALEWARHVIEGLPGRPARPPLTPAPHCSEGEARYLRFENWAEEADGVARLVRWLIDSRGVEPADIAVMFRSNFNNAWSGPLSERLVEHGVPVISAGEVADMLAEAQNRRLLALARLLVHHEDSLAWWTLLHLTSGIGPAVRDHFFDRAEQGGRTFAGQLLADHAADYPVLASGAATRVRKVVEAALLVITALDFEGADLGDAGWGTWLVDNAGEFGGCDELFAGLLVELDGLIDREEGLARFLAQVQPVGTDLRSGRSAEAVRLMTRATDYLYLTWSGRRIGPTARTGAPRVGAGRNRSPLLTHGPVPSEAGSAHLESLGA